MLGQTYVSPLAVSPMPNGDVHPSIAAPLLLKSNCVMFVPCLTFPCTDLDWLCRSVLWKCATRTHARGAVPRRHCQIRSGDGGVRRQCLYAWRHAIYCELQRDTAMPIYEYHCLVCNRDFETLVRTSASDVECINCGSELLERKFSVFGSKVGERVPTSGGGGGSCGCGSCTCH